MRSAVPIAFVAMALVAAGVWAGDDPPRLAIDLDDQFGISHSEREFFGTVTLLLGGGRKGIKYIDEWGPPLLGELEEGIADGTIAPVRFAHLKGAPGFVRKRIVASFSRNPDDWILLDWKGIIAGTWGAEKKAANLYIFNRDGQIVFRSGLKDFDQGQLNIIVQAVGRAVGESAAEGSDG